MRNHIRLFTVYELISWKWDYVHGATPATKSPFFSNTSQCQDVAWTWKCSSLRVFQETLDVPRCGFCRNAPIYSNFQNKQEYNHKGDLHLGIWQVPRKQTKVERTLGFWVWLVWARSWLCSVTWLQSLNLSELSLSVQWDNNTYLLGLLELNERICIKYSVQGPYHIGL